MKNYIVQDGCWNCKYVFRKHDYEDEDEYYCIFNAPKRPLCISVAMNESPDNEDEWNNAYDKWEIWSEKYIVFKCGKCDNYIRRKEL